MAYYDNIRLEKGMYAVSGKSFTKVLEEMDPSENYRGTQLEDAVNVLLNGDGNENPAKEVELAGESLTYQDLINLWGEFDEHEMNTMLVDTQAMMKLLALEELKDPATGLNFQGTGKLSTPMGANLYKSIAVPAGKNIVRFYNSWQPPLPITGI